MPKSPNISHKGIITYEPCKCGTLPKGAVHVKLDGKVLEVLR